MATRRACIRLDPLLHHEKLLHQDIGLRDEDDLNHAALDLVLELPAEAASGRQQPLLGLLEPEDDALLARLGPAVEELEQQYRLARPRHPSDEQTRTAGNSLPQQFVELRDAGLAARRAGSPVLALDSDSGGEHLDALRGDDEGALVAAVFGATELHELDEPLLLAGLFALRDQEQAVDHREERIGADIEGSVFSEQEGGDLPGHEVHCELVAELA